MKNHLQNLPYIPSGMVPGFCSFRLIISSLCAAVLLATALVSNAETTIPVPQESKKSDGLTSQIEFSAFHLFSESPSDIIPSETPETLELCEGTCTFVIRFGTKGVLMTKDNTGRIPEAQILSWNESFAEQFQTVDVKDLGVDPIDRPFLHFSNRLYVFAITNSGSFEIIEGSLSGTDGTQSRRRFSGGTRHTSNLGGGGLIEIPEEDQCSTIKETRNISCDETKSGYHLAGTKCDVEVCNGASSNRVLGCESHSVTIPKNIANNMFAGTRPISCTSQ
ncbi:MAG: hypothetical protein OXC80_13120 [Gammaproteobacteria bacterium]|nr:hypothetical protein [Gammaproteobacteria bacterium]